MRNARNACAMSTMSTPQKKNLTPRALQSRIDAAFAALTPACLPAAVAAVAAEHPGLKAEVTPIPSKTVRPMRPFEVARNSPIVAAINRAYGNAVGGAQPTGALPPACFFVTDAAHLLHDGRMQGIVCGPGGRYNTMPDERVDIPDFLAAIRIYMATMQDICTLA